MKNDCIVAAWNTIEPSGAQDARMLSAILSANRSEHKRKEKRMLHTKKLLIPAVCLVLLAVVGVTGIRLNWFTASREPIEAESEGAPVNETECKVPNPILDEELDAAFGYLFPTEIEEGYALTEDGFNLYSDGADALHTKHRVLKATYYNEELNDTLLIEVAPNTYFGGYLKNTPYGVVQYGDPQTDGTRSSMIFFENDGITILYKFGKTDIAAMDAETAERFYAMVHSARCFCRVSPAESEENDEIDIDG
jgi:hypothetical protein